METYATLMCRLIERSLQSGSASAYLFIGTDASFRGELINRCADSFPGAEQIRVDPDSEQQASISVERVRDVRACLSRTTLGSTPRFVICEQAELLTVQAGNALLKVIEEPPAATLWLLGCVSEEGVLPTIVSRCQRIRLPSLPVSALTQERAKRTTSWLASLSAPVWVRLTGDEQEPRVVHDLDEQEQHIRRALHECAEHTEALSLLIRIVDRLRELRMSRSLSLSRWAKDRIALEGLEPEQP